ncbi:uncharacterized [Tachysurus ichikawai]
MISCHLKDNKQAAIDRWRRHVIFGTLLLNIKENQWRLHRGMEREEWSSVSGLFELIFLSLWLPTSRSPQPPSRLLHSPLTADLARSTLASDWTKGREESKRIKCDTPTNAVKLSSRSKGRCRRRRGVQTGVPSYSKSQDKCMNSYRQRAPAQLLLCPDHFTPMCLKLDDIRANIS